MVEFAIQPGLHVVATPIGNLADLSPRAVYTLHNCSGILCEDTRETGKLLNHFGIHNSLVSYHKFNEQKKQRAIVERLLQGCAIALVSDSGTPAISDPGNRLVRSCYAHEISVYSLPGCSAVSAAVSVSGLGEHGYCFIGFLPAKAGARITLLERYAHMPVALVCFETPHRIAHTVHDLISVFGEDRQLCFARELTKRFETTRLLTLAELRQLLAADTHQLRGEMVLVLAPAPQDTNHTDDKDLIRALAQAGVGSRQASRVLASITSKPQRECYHDYLDYKIPNHAGRSSCDNMKK